MSNGLYKRLFTFLTACFFMTSQALAFTTLMNCCCDNAADQIKTETASHTEHGAPSSSSGHSCHDPAPTEKKSATRCCDEISQLTCCCKPQTIGLRTLHVLPSWSYAPSQKVPTPQEVSAIPYVGLTSQWQRGPVKPPPRFLA